MKWNLLVNRENIFFPLIFIQAIIFFWICRRKINFLENEENKNIPFAGIKGNFLAS